jgi:hypothetical protein
MSSGPITRGIWLGLIASVLLVVALACGESEPDDSQSVSAGEIVPLSVECHTAYRSSVTVGIELEQTLELSSAENRQSIDLRDLRFAGIYFDGEFSGEGRFLKVSVSSIEDDREVTSQLYQLSKTESPQNEFHGGHGFTGLSYAYHPNTQSELQYWCVVV